MDELLVYQLIETVRKHEVLWNRSYPNYANFKFRASEWRKVARELDLPVEMVRRRWRTLRDTYSRSVRKNRTREDDAEPSVGRYCQALDFLKGHLQPKTEPTTENQECSESNTLECSAYTDQNSLNPIFVDSDDKRPLPKSNSNSKKRKYSTFEDSPEPKASKSLEQRVESTLKTVQEYLSNLPEPSPPPTEDDLFCQSLVEKLRKFPTQFRNSAKLEMLRYLSEVEEEFSKLPTPQLRCGPKRSSLYRKS